MEAVVLSEPNVPRPEHATRAIWAGRAARSREAASTDRGRASSFPAEQRWWPFFVCFPGSDSKIDLAKYQPTSEAMRHMTDEREAQERLRHALDNPALDAAIDAFRGEAVTAPEAAPRTPRTAQLNVMMAGSGAGVPVVSAVPSAAPMPSLSAVAPPGLVPATAAAPTKPAKTVPT